MTFPNGKKQAFFLAEMFPREHHTRIRKMQHSAFSDGEASGIPASSLGGGNYSRREKYRQENP